MMMFATLSDRICRLSQPIKDSHQWAPSACSLRHHRATALTVWQRAALRQSKLARTQHPSGVHHIRDPGTSAAVSIAKKFVGILGDTLLIYPETLSDAWSPPLFYALCIFYSICMMCDYCVMSFSLSFLLILFFLTIANLVLFYKSGLSGYLYFTCMELW